MASVNKIFLVGNLTRDPELRHLQSGDKVASFGLGVNKKYKKDDEWKSEVLFIEIIVWNKQAENCVEYLKKGALIHIEGELRLNKWESDKGPQSRHEVRATNIQFLTKKE